MHHDHNYNANLSPPTCSNKDTPFNNVQPLQEKPIIISEVLSSPSCEKMKLNVTSHKIKKETRHQSLSSQWFL